MPFRTIPLAMLLVLAAITLLPAAAPATNLSDLTGQLKTGLIANTTLENRFACHRTLYTIARAVERCMSEKGTSAEIDLLSLVSAGYLKTAPVCLSDGQFTIKIVNASSFCRNTGGILLGDGAVTGAEDKTSAVGLGKCHGFLPKRAEKFIVVTCSLHGSVKIPYDEKAAEKRDAMQCAMNRMKIRQAVHAYLREKLTVSATTLDLKTLVSDGYLKEEPICPEEGNYTIKVSALTRQKVYSATSGETELAADETTASGSVEVGFRGRHHGPPPMPRFERVKVTCSVHKDSAPMPQLQRMPKRPRFGQRGRKPATDETVTDSTETTSDDAATTDSVSETDDASETDDSEAVE